MSELPAAQTERLESWANQAISLGWLSDDARHSLQSASNANPGQLFQQTDRPLVAGLFGGTGVGKSSLLNRLAGEPVARASAERPTSRDITVYVHRSVSVDRLPESFPMQRMRTALHNNDDYRQVMFIDMPDFDSVEESNRDLVDIWLPHLDVVMYVVSPERYRDDQGWQLLKRHAKEHAWLFIINQWDRGNPVQREDFISQLSAQGLAEPLVFCTDCANPEHAPGSDITQASDEFPALRQNLLSLSDDQIVNHLQKHGILARLQKLKELSDTWLAPMSDAATLDRLGAQWTTHCHKHHPEIISALQWPIQQLAQGHIDNTPFWRRLLGWTGKPVQIDENALNTLTRSLNERLNTVFEQFLNQQAYELDIPLRALQQATQDSHRQSLELTRQTLEDSLNQSLLNPGKPWQRKLYLLMGTLCLLLPLASLGWISFRVITAFADGSNDPSAYLGSSFAINSALLIGISWLLPALAHAQLKPSQQQAALQGLNHGTEDVQQQCAAQVHASVVALGEQASQLRQSYHALWTDLPDDDEATLPNTVRRMLSAQISQPPSRSLDVRANTHNSTDSAPLS
ncbi:MAG: GTPase [Granulosicoccus sp.]